MNIDARSEDQGSTKDASKLADESDAGEDLKNGETTPAPNAPAGTPSSSAQVTRVYNLDEEIDGNDPAAVQALLDDWDASQAVLRKTGRDKLPHSQRNPHMTEASDVANQLDKDLLEDSHCKWGWMIYRCTYDSEDEWQEALEALKFSLKEELSFYDATDLLDSLELTIMDDQEFQNATTAQLRKHFKEWATFAPVREQGTGPALSQRYRFFIRVTKENLDSVLAIARANRAKEDVGFRQGHIDLVDASYDLQRQHEENSSGGFEMIDGSEDYQVGWSRIDYQTYFSAYVTMRPEGSWDEIYIRPPEIMLG